MCTHLLEFFMSIFDICVHMSKIGTLSTKLKQHKKASDKLDIFLFLLL